MDSMTEEELATLLEISPSILKRLAVFISAEVKLFDSGGDRSLRGIKLADVSFVGVPIPRWFGYNKFLPPYAIGHKYLKGTLEPPDFPYIISLYFRLCDISIPEIDYDGYTQGVWFVERDRI